MPPASQAFYRSNGFGLLLCVLFLPLHLIALTHHGLWVDELHTFDAIRRDMADLIRDRLQAGHNPFYFMGLKVWCDAVGVSEWSMRAPSVLFAAVGFGFYFLLMRRFLGSDRVFVAAVVLFFLHPFVWWSAREARMYSGLLACCLGSGWFLLRYAEQGRRRDLWGYGLACALGMNLLIGFLLVLPAHLTFVFFHHRRLFWKISAVALAVVALFGPFYALSVQTTDKYAARLNLVFPDPFLIVRKASVMTSTDFKQYRFYESAFLYDLADNLRVFFFLSFVLYAGWWHRRQKKRAGFPEKDLLLFFWYSLAVPGGLLLLSRLANNNKVWYPRYYIAMLPAVTTFAAMTLGQVLPRGCWKKRVFIFFVGLYVALFLFAIASQLLWRGPGIRESIALMREKARPGDGVLFTRAEPLDQAFFFYGWGEQPRLPLPRYADEKALLPLVEEFASGHSRLWVWLHGAKGSPVHDLLEDRPGYQRLVKIRLGECKVLCYEKQAR